MWVVDSLRFPRRRCDCYIACGIPNCFSLSNFATKLRNKWIANVRDDWKPFSEIIKWHGRNCCRERHSHSMQKTAIKYLSEADFWFWYFRLIVQQRHRTQPSVSHRIGKLYVNMHVMHITSNSANKWISRHIFIWGLGQTEKVEKWKTMALHSIENWRKMFDGNRKVIKYSYGLQYSIRFCRMRLHV